ncbi:O-fucosyltransferase 29-like [Aristolochia californica]|uniref:O-fucosyltransferase 29-like n=1 Tax=Aristolochia californica TaxID=171875 RepID=UPI0035E34935
MAELWICNLERLCRHLSPRRLAAFIATQTHFLQNWRLPRKATLRTFLCGLLLFGLGLFSLFIGYDVPDTEWHTDWYSQRGMKRALYTTLVRGRQAQIDIWKSEYSKFYYGCSERSRDFAPAVRERLSNGYLLIATSGGLNQQRTGITDAVVVARILNATLVLPELDHFSFWKDDSDFSNIFDVGWFISSLSKDITIVKRVPDKVMRSMERPPYTMRVPRRSNPEYYLDQVLPILLRRTVVQLTKFDYRLTNSLNEDLQKLRCRVNFHALRFVKPIREIGQKIVKKMQKMNPRFIAVHLRFEPDMLAFSGCYYGGGDKERNDLAKIRKQWPNLPEMSPDGERKRGKCPLAPNEVGLMLRALGFGNDTNLYIASGEIYGGEETLRPLRQLFPNLYTKEMLAGQGLKPFLSFSSRLAAIDYIVCEESDVFVTNNNGNMAKLLAGRRRYMGHKRTIRPNAKKLSSLFIARNMIDWKTFSKKVKAYQRGFMGDPGEMKPGKGEFLEFPYSCVCKAAPSVYNYSSNQTNLTVELNDLRPERVVGIQGNVTHFQQ